MRATVHGPAINALCSDTSRRRRGPAIVSNSYHGRARPTGYAVRRRDELDRTQRGAVRLPRGAPRGRRHGPRDQLPARRRPHLAGAVGARHGGARGRQRAAVRRRRRRDAPTRPGNAPAADVLAFVDRYGADEIVIGVRKRTPDSKTLLGSVARDILLDSTVPIRVVPVSGGR
ncbi:universal stress protein [Halobaculum litoreum]|uniref:Universal stress protein n=1 Tax=Halobaculum litoreum TaxID=3031998 RepID=A0ABD5XU30_9EURY